MDDIEAGLSEWLPVEPPSPYGYFGLGRTAAPRPPPEPVGLVRRVLARWLHGVAVKLNRGWME